MMLVNNLYRSSKRLRVVLSNVPWRTAHLFMRVIILILKLCENLPEIAMALKILLITIYPALGRRRYRSRENPGGPGKYA